MSRKVFTAGVIGGAVLLLLGCEVLVDYELELSADGSSVMDMTMTLDEDAVRVFGSPRRFAAEFDVIDEFEGMEIVSTEIDDSDPNAQRIELSVEGEDASALDGYLRSGGDVEGSYTDMGDGVYLLQLSPEAPDPFVIAELAVTFPGNIVSMSGGEESRNGRTVIWDPHDGEPLSLTVDTNTSGMTVTLVVGGLLLAAIVLAGVLASRRRADSA